MLGDLDLEAAIQRLLGAGRIVETGALNPGDPVFDAGEADGLISGDLREGTRARGAGSVLVEGKLAGVEGRSCGIQVEGEAIIRGSARHARIAAKSIRIGGTVERCRLTSAEGIEVGGDLAASQVVLGVCDQGQQQLALLKRQADQVVQQQRLLAQRLAIEERRIHKLVTATRLSCEVNLGQLVRLRSERLQVSLQAFYRVVGPRPDEEIELALGDFFSRAVAGRLAYANQDYLKSNPNNQKVFVRVLGDLRQLFLLTRQVDRCGERRSELAAAGQAVADSLVQRQPVLRVRGAVVPEVRLSVVVPLIQRSDRDEVIIETAMEMLTVVADGQGTDCLIRLVDRDGAETTCPVSAERLRAVAFRLADSGRVACDPSS